MEEQYSCDEDDWDAEEEKKSLLSSRSTVSSRGGRLSLQGGQEVDMSSMAGGGAGIYFSDDEDATEFVTSDQRDRSLKGDVSPRRVSGDSLVRGSSAGFETSSQVARSILGGIFTSLPPLRDEASEEVQELEFSQPGDEEHLDEGDPDEKEDPRVEVAKRMEELDQVHKSFSERMTDWINSVSIKQKEMEEEEDRCESGVEGASRGREEALFDDRVSSRSDLDSKDGQSDDLRDDMPSRQGSIGVWDKESTLDDTCKSSDSQKMIESEKGSIGDGGNSKYIEVENIDETMSQNYEEDLRNKFHSDRSQRGIAFSMIPSLAFSSYEEGFAKAQMTNGRQLYDKGLIRQRGVGSRVRSLPFPEAPPPPQYRKVVETMEQRMVVEADGTQVVDTKHRREEEQSNGRDKGWPWCASVVFALGSFGFLLLCLLLVFVFLPNQHSEELRRCLLKDTQVLGQEADIIESI